jgi:hypothetical protein
MPKLEALRSRLSAALVAALTGVAWAALAQQPTPGVTEDPALVASRALALELGTRLRAALVEALERGGPAAAIDVCKDVAPALAAEISRRSGAKVARTSRRFRNPLNAPEPWAATVLDELAASIDAGRAAASLEFFARTDGDVRYMRPIVAEPLCLVCHGTALAPEVSAALAASYPHDLATGYDAGDLRGAFVVTWPARAP